MKNKILHLSHTDINFDSRIIKEMISLQKIFPDSEIQGIGIKLDENEKLKKSNTTNSLEILSLSLHSKKLTLIPKSLRHFFTLIEFFIRVMFDKRRLKSPNIVHSHDVIPIPICLIMKLFFGSKIIYDAHELESDRAGLGKIMGKAVLLVEKIAWKWIDGFITVSPEIMNWYYEEFSDKPGKVILNSPLIQEDHLSKNIQKDYLKKIFNIPDESIIYIYIGMLTEGRGIKNLLAVFEKLKNTKHHIVFLGHGHLSDHIKLKQNNNSNIHLHESVKHEQVVPIASSADIGLCMLENVSLSDYLCLPNKLFEYSFANLHIISSSFPSIRNFIEKYNCGICCEDSEESIVCAIENMQEIIDSDEKKFSKIIAECSWERQEKNLYDVYNEFL